MLTKKDKENIIKAFKMVDVKKMEIDNVDPEHIKWFRFGSYNGMMVASEIVKSMPEQKRKSGLTKKKSSDTMVS